MHYLLRVTQLLTVPIIAVWSASCMESTPLTPSGQDSLETRQRSSHPTPLTLASVGASDFSKIAFVSERDGNREIYLVSEDGSDLIRLTNHPGADDRPAISPDGNWVYFWSRRTGRTEIFRVSIDGTKLEQFTFGLPTNAGVAGIEPHPDGSHFLISLRNPASSVWEIVRLEADGSVGTTIVDQNADGHRLDSTDPHLAANSSKIVMRRNRPFNGHSSEIWIADGDGSGLKQLTSSPGLLRSWLPGVVKENGVDKIVYAFRPSTAASTNQIVKMNLDGSEKTDISPDDRSEGSPDGPHGPGASARSGEIIFTSVKGNDRAIWRMDADGTRRIQVTDAGTRLPYWWIGGVAIGVDIKPGSSPNSVNIKGARARGSTGNENAGLLPVAALSSAEFDATSLEPGSVTLSSKGTDGTPVAMPNRTTLRASLEDVNDDGRLDQVFHFDLAELVESGQLTEATTRLCLEGRTDEDLQVRGCDSVRVLD